MFGGGGMNPQKMQQMMKQMGIDVDEIDATEVVIKQADGDQLVFEDPDVTKMDARGQETYQIIGEPETVESAGELEAGEESGDEATEEGIPQDDVDLVVQRTGATEADARAVLEATDGDLAAAISRLE
ncbi:nascent polypeptide-associated complex protein [Halobacterium sp. CBA1126]|uniref:nascent polypeptide-associated complex protein n=1 Tax=Halobacterium sp. CBA1126 TaxID=2668074 RepID=UPI0012F88DAB|nr:nascent polypeptide-associated complex protein [Halobacterium sp. CBA1126]MUV61477.1 nascent polypeptide-associated complex protein [Halobacterium sp. CBA1126]